MLLAVSTCHIALGLIYYNQCPASSWLTLTLIITGVIGVFMSIIALIVHRFDAYDGSNKWNLLVTYILFLYLIGSRIANSIMVFRLASQSKSHTHCAAALHWVSTLLLIVSYSIIIITCCILLNLHLLQKKHRKYPKLQEINNAITKFYLIMYICWL
jgi:hypothetical protein